MGWRNSPCWHSNRLGNMVSVLAYSHHGRLTWLACRPTARTARAAGLQPGRLALPAYRQDGSPCRPTARTARPAGLQPGRLALLTNRCWHGMDIQQDTQGENAMPPLQAKLCIASSRIKTSKRIYYVSNNLFSLASNNH